MLPWLGRHTGKILSTMQHGSYIYGLLPNDIADAIIATNDFPHIRVFRLGNFATHARMYNESLGSFD